MTFPHREGTQRARQATRDVHEGMSCFVGWSTLKGGGARKRGLLSCGMPAGEAPINPQKVGLCADCRHARRVESDRGSVFFLCELALTDPRFQKYPRLPVVTCEGYEKAGESSPPETSRTTG